MLSACRAASFLARRDCDEVDEEAETDKALTELAESEINVEAASCASEK